MKVRIVPYNAGSKSARLFAAALSEELGYHVYRGTPRSNRYNIPWGNPEGVNANKLGSFRVLGDAGISIPDWTTDRSEAEQWLANGKTVVCRTKLRASEGRGIVLVTPQDSASVVDAPLYVKYVPKKKEFRVHVLGGETILVQEKRIRSGSGETVDYKIRNHGDWVFCTKDIVEPQGLREVGLAAVLATCPVTLSGAADVVWNEKQNRCYVLEVNSAPGLCPSSAKVYARFVKEKLDELV